MAPPPSGSRKEGKERSPGALSSPLSREKDIKDWKGLCVNCAKRDTCLLPGSEGGVWHCADYVEER
jgi:hypothetical protein